MKETDRQTEIARESARESARERAIEKVRETAIQRTSEGLPGGQLHGQVGRDAPGQVDVVLPLLLRQADVLGPPVGDAGLQGLLRGDGQLLGGQRVVPRGQPLDLTGLRGWEVRETEGGDGGGRR